MRIVRTLYVALRHTRRDGVKNVYFERSLVHFEINFSILLAVKICNSYTGPNTNFPLHGFPEKSSLDQNINTIFFILSAVTTKLVQIGQVSAFRFGQVLMYKPLLKEKRTQEIISFLRADINIYFSSKVHPLLRYFWYRL